MSEAKLPINDKRFQKVHNDPRFARSGKRKHKVGIDKRFAAVLDDKKFQSVQGKYDKYGRKNPMKNENMGKFYRLDEDNSEDRLSKNTKTNFKGKNKRITSESDSDSSTSSSDQEPSSPRHQEQEKKLSAHESRFEYLNRMARGELQSDSDSDSDDSTSSQEDEIEEVVEKKEDIPMSGEIYKRFAVLDCDWSRMRAVDIFALCESFCPSTGTIENVTIYPSDYGLEKMKQEEINGPQGLWEDKQEKEDEMNESENDDDDDDPLGIKKRVDAEDENGFDPEKLRAYELQKLKYYYAIVTCDSAQTASVIFDQCDQLEYETSSNLLDLRFVPDEVEFSNPPKETCTSVPESYKPSIFATNALQSTDINLTWEEDDEARQEFLTRTNEWRNANDEEFSAYIASSDSDTGDEVHSDSDDNKSVDGNKEQSKDEKKKRRIQKMKEKKKLYRKMLLGSDEDDNEDDSSGISDMDVNGESDDDTSSINTGSAGPEDANGDMELTFAPEASEILRRKKQKELEANETPFEKYTREKKAERNLKRHEKRKQRKEEARQQADTIKEIKSQRKGKSTVSNQATLLREALFDGKDENDNRDNEIVTESGMAIASDRNFDMKSIALHEKIKKLKGKRKAKELKKLQENYKNNGLQEGFEFNANDPRFGAIYERGSAFQLDPTDAKFKKSNATEAIFQTRRKRMEDISSHSSTTLHDMQLNNNNVQETNNNPSSNISAMVENIKRKASQNNKDKRKKTKT